MNFKTIFPRFYWPLLALLCVAYAWRPLEGGYDFWAHAMVGKWIWINHSVPRENLFLWSEPGTPWVAHSWLSELFFFGMLAQGGPAAVAIFNAAMVVATFFVLWRLWKREGKFSAWVPFVFALAIWISAPRFQPRQELISALFLTLLLTFLIAWEEGRFDEIRKPGFAFIVMATAVFFALWVNLHALAAVGILVLVTTLLGNFFQARQEALRENPGLQRRTRLLLVLGIIGLAATLCNPYGALYWTAAGVLQSGSQAQFVEEWKPMWIAPAMLEYILALAVLGAIALFAWRANPQRRWSHFLWWLLASALMLRSRRMLWLAAILFLAVMAANARYLDTPTLWKKWRKLTRGDQNEAIPHAMRVIAQAGAVICLLAWVLAATARHTPKIAGSWSTLVRNVPEGAVQFLQPRAASLRLFNDYEDSSYFQWRLNGEGLNRPGRQGQLPLYIDLLNAYPDRLMFEYFDILGADSSGLKRLEERKINCIVLGEHHWNKPLVKFLNSSGSAWRLVWGDAQSKIWMKRSQHAH